MIKSIGAMLAMAILFALGGCNTTVPAGDASPPANLDVGDGGGGGGY